MKVLLILTLLVLNVYTQSENFIKLCIDLTFANGKFSAYCSNKFNNIIRLTIDANECLANSDGRLVPRKNGNALDSCKDCVFKWPFFSCNCGLRNKKRTKSNIPFIKFLDYDQANSKLVCIQMLEFLQDSEDA